MICAFCKENIDDDSFYCDMCGEEIKLCPSCHKTGKSKVCTACGRTLVVAKSQAGGNHQGLTRVHQSVSQVADVEQEPLSTVPTRTGTYRLPDTVTTPVTIPELRLLNKNINVDLAIQNNTVIGRTTGDYASIFGTYVQVSGKHCRFSYDSLKGWCVTDLGSTNGTKLNNSALIPNISQALRDQMYLKIANIEFFVRIMTP
jgi:predicted RNA-binding Zn-ribbon protein involved in translation (DUF1610 family)